MKKSMPPKPEESTQSRMTAKGRVQDINYNKSYIGSTTSVAPYFGGVAPSTSEALLRLPRLIGNQAVIGMIQRSPEQGAKGEAPANTPSEEPPRETKYVIHDLWVEKQVIYSKRLPDNWEFIEEINKSMGGKFVLPLRIYDGLQKDLDSAMVAVRDWLKTRGYDIDIPTYRLEKGYEKPFVSLVLKIYGEGTPEESKLP